MDSVFNVTQLLRDISTWLTGLVPLAGTAAIAYHAVAKNAATDESTAAQHTRAQRSVLIGTAIGTGAAALVNFLMRYVGQ